MSLSQRLKWMVLKMQEAFDIDESNKYAEELITENHEFQTQINDWLMCRGETGKSSVVFFWDDRDTDEKGEKQPPGNPHGKTSFVPVDGMKGKIGYFIRQTEGNKAVNTKVAQDATVSYGELAPGLLNLFTGTLEKVFTPLIKEVDQWGKLKEEKQKLTFLEQTDEFGAILKQQLQSMKGDVVLEVPPFAFDAKFTFDVYDLKPSVYNKLANHPDLSKECVKRMQKWNDAIKAFLTANNPDNLGSIEPALGPKVEIEYWGRRLLSLQSIFDQLHCRHGKGVMGVVKAVSEMSAHEQNQTAKDNKEIWHKIDIELTEHMNEAADNVKFLANMDKFLEPLYRGTPMAVQEALPTLMAALKQIYTLSRHYGTPARMTGLFLRMTNEIIVCCKRFLNGGKAANPGRMWAHNPSELIGHYKMCIALGEAYKAEYAATKEKLAAIPKGRQFSFDEATLFNKYNIFTRRLEKLIDMFTSVHQHQALMYEEIDGMEPLIAAYGDLLAAFQKKNHDLLDYDLTIFERDFVEFMMRNSQIEANIQRFIDKTFADITHIMPALTRLAQFRRVLLRSTLREDLDDKFLLIFKQFGVEVQHVEDLYAKESAKPPISRNTPPVTGAIRWSRQLLDRLYGPMQVFTQNPIVFAPKESKKIIKQFNKVAKVLVQFEVAYYADWCKGVEKTKAALQQPLIVLRHGELEVNFDPKLFTLMKEARNLRQMGFTDLPEGAKTVILLEDKLKNFYQQIRAALETYNSFARCSPVLRTLMKQHVFDVELVLKPGLTTMTWTSMNIDVFVEGMVAAMDRFEALVNQVKDVVKNRIQANLDAVENALFVDILDGTSVTIEEFTQMQLKAQAKSLDTITMKNTEIERAVEELISIVMSFPIHPSIVRPSVKELTLVKLHYSRAFQHAVLRCVQKSLDVIKRRVTPYQQFTNVGEVALFSVELQLVVPDVRVFPTLTQVQACLNTVVTDIVAATHKIFDWGVAADGSPCPRVELYDSIAQDKLVVASVLLLSGAVDTTKQQVTERLTVYNKFAWLWKDDLEKEYKKFLDSFGGNPTLDDYRNKLNTFRAVEITVSQLVPIPPIGALHVKPENLKEQLKSECNRWKLQFSEKLHNEAKGGMESIIERTKNYRTRMSFEVKDLPSLSGVMDVFAEIREVQSWIDFEFTRVLDIYSALEKLFPPGSAGGLIGQDERDAKAVLKSNWKTMLAESETILLGVQTIKDNYKGKLIEDVQVMLVEAAEFRKDYLENGPMVVGIPPEEAMTRLNKYTRLFEALDRDDKIYKAGERLFGMPVTKHPGLEDTAKEVGLLVQLYSLWKDVNTSIDEYKNILWSDTINHIPTMTEVAEKYAQKVKTLPKGLKTWPAFLDLQASLEDFLTILPMLQDLAKPSMKKRHWDDIMALTQKPDWFQFVQGRDEEELDPGMKLRAVLEAGMLPVKEDVEEVIVAAEKQKGIRDKLNEIKQIWDQQFLEFAPWKARQDTLLSAAKNGLIIEKLEESITTVGQLLSMKHVKPFQQEAQDWFAKLNDVSEVLEGWIKTQLSWTALEPVFTGGDIARQMPQISKIFSKYDKEWATRLMPKAKEMKNVVAVCRDEYIKGMLPEIAQQLETCQKALDGYLETKRNRFPRFYFVSNPALLLILSRGSDLVAVQECFQALFDSITNVTFKGNMIVKYLGLQSGNGNAMDSEEIDCIKPVSATGNIEDWLCELEKEQYVTMKAACKKCALECVGADFPLEEFAGRSLGQFALLGIQFAWTYAVETALKTAGKPPPPPAPGKTYKLNSKQPLKIAKDATVSMMEKLAVMTLGDIPTRMERTKIETLVTIQVHARDVLEVIIDKWAYNLLLFENTHTDFEWQKQARFYWNIEDDACQIRVADTMNPYCYEYLGCKERLCITPLTDRCYIALTQALAMYFGGAPAGPAGTGKTETVKDLGRGLGKYVVVMNCSDQMRYTDTAKIFKGLCMSGSWGCFDEFNRIDLEVLSVVAQQVMSVLNAFKANAKVFSFPDSVELVTIDRRVGFFITMNPGYAGRQELPENLKALFRGVTMMVPDFEIIIKVKLASCGYLEYNPLAKKFKVLYDLCKEQLSKQRHYDFGLRNILSVLRTAGSALRVQLREDKALKASKELEEMLLMRTLRDINLSKFVSDDVGLFRSLLGDLFPEQPDPPIRLFTAEEEGMEKIVKKEGLQYLPSWKLKMVQLFETSLVRHGLMMIGPAGSGKTKAIDVLLEALTLINNPHKIVKMNPKAITATEMFGENDRLTGEWIWGIFPEIWKKCNDLSKPYRSWIICDGPVDAVWIENLNTVLDDNKLLTLANGDRYKMTDNCKILFEAEDLRNASPATVSRAGIVYVSAEDLGWMPIVESWMQKRTKEEATILKALYMKFCEESGMWEVLPRTMKKVCGASMVHQVTNLMALIEGLLQPFVEKQTVLKPDEYERIFLYAVAWSIGGLYQDGNRVKFNDYFSKLTTQLGSGASWPKLEAADHTIFEYYVDPETLKWNLWRAPGWKYPEGAFRFSACLVPTMDSTRAEYIVACLHKIQKPVLIVGEPGTAKTATIFQFTDKFDPQTQTLKKVNFSSATTTRMFQSSIEADIEKKQGKTFGPPGGKFMTVFLDDVAMPEVNKWGDQATLEIVRQVVAEEGMYFLARDKRGERMALERLQYVAAMPHPGGGRNDIPNRLKRHFFMFNMPPPSNTSIDNIYGSMMRGRHNGNKEFLDLIEIMTVTTIAIWNKIKVKMLPTPAKFHYVFNMRDLSRVFQGVLHAPSDVIPDGISFLMLWKHECNRVFSDKLVSLEDKKWYDTELHKLIHEKFGADKAEKLKQEVFWVDYMRDDVIDPETDAVLEEAPKIYEMVPDMIAMRERLEMFMFKHNEEPKNIKKLDLVLFDDAIRHLVRIARIIGMPRSSALLVGVGGSGKQSLTKLACYIARHEQATITISKFYKVADFLTDLQQMFIKVGKEGKKLTFVFTDSMVLYEDFLEYINQILSTGEVAGLFTRDEKTLMAGDLRARAKKEIPGFDDTNENLLKYLSDLLRDNFHIVLCFSPMNDKFKERARRFPSLISGCVIDWFLRWPVDALMAVSAKFIRDPKFTVECDEDQLQSLIAVIGNIHEIIVLGCDEYFASYRRSVFVTPKSYLSFIASYKLLYTKKLEINVDQEKRVRLGLQKLLDAAADVEEMKIALAKKKKVLIQAEKSANEFLEKLTVSSAEAAIKAEKAGVIETACNEEAARIEADRAVAQKDLDAAMPFVIAAQQAASSITKDDVSFVTKLPNPPVLIKLIMDGVLLLMLRPINPVANPKEMEGLGLTKADMVTWFDDSYDAYAKSMMMDSAFLNNLLNFPKDAINDETIELIMPYINVPAFQPDIAGKKANAAKGLCAWVIAMKDYTAASKIVKPRLEALGIAQAKLDVAMAQLRAAQADKKAAEDEVAALQKAFDEQMTEKAAIALDAQLTATRMEQANELITSLSGERTRWNEDCEMFTDLKRRLVGDCALACAFVSYCGPFNETFRAKLIKYFYDDCIKRGIPVTENLALTKFLVDETVVAEWNNQGLPKDDLSVQNGILTTQASRFPLMIDPQAQALDWIKQRCAPLPTFGVTTISNKYFRENCTLAISEGLPLIIEGIENDVDPMLDPVLDKNVVKKGRRFEITMFGDKTIEYSDKFYMYLITKLSNPKFSPELSARTTVIDFSVTIKGLENQLLSRVLQEEQAALEEQRQNLVKEVNFNTINLKNLDASLLKQLSASSGNLLEDRELIQMLRDTKVKAQEVKDKIASSVETEIMINKKRELYRPVACRGSIMYFVIVDLQALNWMYQTSLAQFLQWFDQSLRESTKDRSAQKRVNNIIEFMTFCVYRNIMRSLFVRDQVTYKIMMTIRILTIEGKNGNFLNTELVDLLLKGGSMLAPDDPPYSWLQPTAWLNAMQLSITLPELFRDLITNIRQNEKMWYAWYMESAPENVPIPVWEERFAGHPMGKYMRWLLVRSLRDDRAVYSSNAFIADSLGQPYVDPLTVTLDGVWSDSSAYVPIVLLLSPGADPTAELDLLAKKKKVEIRAVSMGEGQEPNAKKAIEVASAAGNFAVLQNCHLGLVFMAKLLDLLNELFEKTPPQPGFRLWITCEPHPLFPISVLQRAIKVTNEPPQGMKAGMLRSFSTLVDQDRLNRHEMNETWQGLIWASCFMHSVVQERRKFGPIGWSVPYEFNNGDLEASLTFLERHISQVKANIQWQTVQYMVCEVQYGGRITDDFDRVLFSTFGRRWLDPVVLSPGYLFADTGHQYKSFKSDAIEEYRKFIMTLPSADSPEVFCLHANADLTFGTANTLYMLTAIQETQPKEGGGGKGKTREEIVYDIAQELLDKQVPPKFDMEQVRKDVRSRPKAELEWYFGGSKQLQEAIAASPTGKIDGLTIPLGVFLFQEIERINRTINNVRETLIELQNAIRGETIMTPDLQAALDFIYMAKPPKSWYTAPAGDLIAWVSPSLALWMTGLTDRDKQLRTWLNTTRPITYWLTGFFNPQGFLTAMRQEVARKHKKTAQEDAWALDDVVLHADVLDVLWHAPFEEHKNLKAGPKEGVYVHGLYLEGCRWDKDKKQLAEAEPKRLFSPLPVLHMTAKNGVAMDKFKVENAKVNFYTCPIYMQPRRTGLNYINKVGLRTDKDPNWWCLRGVALLCDTAVS